MLDLNSSPLLWEAQIAERHREVAALTPIARVSVSRRSVRTALAGLFAHLALHLDGRAVDSVVDRHPQPAGRV
jgi:hypothetical protein